MLKVLLRLKSLSSSSLSVDKQTAVSVILLYFSLRTCSATDLSFKKDIGLLKRLLLYRMAEASTTTPSSATLGILATSVTTTELSVVVSNFTGAPIMDDFYNAIFIGNGTLEKQFQDVFENAVPSLKALSVNTTDRITRQRALVELAVKMQPLIAPLAANHPNLTSKVMALGQILDSNRTGRDGYGGGGGGYGGGGGGGGGGYGGGGGGGGGWGGGGGKCCCCGGSMPVMMVTGWGGGGGGGGNNDQLLSYLLAKGGSSSDSSALQTLLPLLFGLIALLIMKLPT